MGWKGWTTLGLIGAAVAYPMIKRKLGSSEMSGGFDANIGGNQVSAKGSVKSKPATETWASGNNP